MKKYLVLIASCLLALPVLAQRQDEKRPEQRPAEARPAENQREAQPARNMPRANQGRIPAAPVKREPQAKPETERRDGGRTNNIPHVANDRWYGHDQPNDARYRLARPFEHGHFEHFGPQYVYGVTRIDTNLHRFWLPSGEYFEVSPWDWPLASDWCWNCGDDFTVYEDPDHPGWYLLYNIHTGQYIHAQFMGT